MKYIALPALGCAVLSLASLASLAPIAQDESTSDVAINGETINLLEGMVRSSQVHWPKQMESARAALGRSPRGVIAHLVEKLEHDEQIPGEWSESQTYTVCGNALTLLERLTDERICGLGRDWLGFSTHDHRSTDPSTDKVQGPWRAWLQVREDLPTAEWFWGLSYAELQRISPLMRQPEASWDPAAVDVIRDLGPRAYPYLLDKLVDDEYAVTGKQFCAQANALLRRLTGKDVGSIDRTELLRLDPEHPDRKHRLAIHRNRASMRWIQQRWTAVLVSV